MNILGITHQASYNPAACILVDGKLIAFAEEERFIRIKHAFAHIPKSAIAFCLEKALLTPKDIDVVAIGWERPPTSSTHGKIRKIMVGFDLFRHALRSSGTFSLKKLRPEIVSWAVLGLKDVELQTYLKRFQSVKKVIYYSHHLAHVASAVFTSSFNSGNFITLDNRGGFESGLLGCFKKDDIEIIAQIPIQSSLGAMYENVTGLLGFRPHSHEGKVMGLSAYGRPFAKKFCSYLGEFGINVNWNLIESVASIVNEQCGSDPTKDARKDIAATVQRDLEEVVLMLLEDLVSLTGYKNLHLAGGIALNSNMNGRIFDSKLVKDLFVQPAANDAGVALGAAILAGIEFNEKTSVKMNHAYYGPSYSNEEIKKILENLKLKYEYQEDIEGAVAELLAKGKIVGWLRGRMEIGPRALGARSILADPSDSGMKDKINYFVKHREWWRPFAPSISIEYSNRYLPNLRDAPFMIVNSDVREEHLGEIVSATHIDKTCRPQTVEKEYCPSYYKLIENFRKIKGAPAILNTSFNYQGEPIVCTPSDALRTFFSTGLDNLALENFLIKK
jgi:carbamoyltransferase